MSKNFLILFIYLSFITKSLGGINSANPILSRLTFSDIFGFLTLFFGLKLLIQGYRQTNKISNIYSLGVLLVISMILPVFLSLNPQATIIESFIVFFLILISILIYQCFKNSLYEDLFPIIINTTILAAFFGFYDIIATIIGLPRIFSERALGEVISGFRNAGQAGAYFLIMLTILIPLYYSKLRFYLIIKYQRRLKFAVIIGILFLLATGKIAAFIGFIIGATLFLLKRRSFKLLFLMLFLGFFIYFIFNNIEQFAPKFYNRINYKIESRLIENYQGTSNNTFFEENFGGAIDAFQDNPITGSGIGGFYGNYGRYEVHSTYLKMLGEGGIIVTFFYLIFIVTFLKLFENRKAKNPYSEYLNLILPFVIGCLISWSYTYHLRKREFWILIAIIVIIKSHSKIKWQNKLTG